ncbi:MAG: prepilin peptidase [Deltaproteobacteria bacterium]|nr:prepilin peptidase [Deltaproteobacteria bacterium]MBW1928563.1 prepilin peptidase [Deltaproteobacteria bacterium]MBW2025313.1 prepilin peptidase [Deltaproteobacteria bacterium]MBW2126562.1 prepilin peptidase [Deltaproteobacteria bacterium]
MNPDAILTIFSFLFGLALGSFANVCIYRLPLGRSIVCPPSSCPHCGQQIKFYDNIPLLSYLLLKGKCRVCGHPISAQYPLVELSMGLISLALFIRYGASYQYILYLLFTGSLVVITFIDLHHQIIPDVVSLPGIAVGFLSSFFLISVSWIDSVIGIVAGGGALLVIAIIFEKLTGREGMGGGDIKLLAMIGAWMGWKALPFIVLVSSLAGTIIGGGALLITGKGYGVRIPFGPFLAMGTLIYFFFGSMILQWYSRLFF